MGKFKAYITIFQLVLPFVLYAQYSRIQVTISDTSQQGFLDKVEAKLLQHVKSIQNDKFKADLSIFEADFAQDDWGLLLTKMEVKALKIINNCIPTEKYILYLDWSQNLDTAFLIGFAKCYYDTIKQSHYPFERVVCCPLFKVLLNEYGVFLSKPEMEKLSTIVKAKFLKNIDDSGLVRDNNVTLRIITFNKSDSLIQAPWDHWVNKFTKLLLSGEMRCYFDYNCLNPLTPAEMRKSFYHIYNINDENGKEFKINSVCSFISIEIAEQWSFNLSTQPGNYNFKPFLVINRKIISIGFLPSYRDMKGDSAQTIIRYKYEPTLWLKYDDIENFSKYDSNKKFGLFDALLDSDLFRRLNLKYLYGQ